MQRPTMPRALTPLRRGSFRLLTAGQVTSNVGDACYAVALPWYVLAVHGGAVLLGTVLAAYGIPRTALIAVGGYASDRWRPQTVMMAADTVHALAVAGLAVRRLSGRPARSCWYPSRWCWAPERACSCPDRFRSSRRYLQSANALSSSGTQLATLAGPVVGGALAALGSPAIAFGLDAASFEVSAVTLAGLRGARLLPSPAGCARRPGAGSRTDSARGNTREPVPSLLTLFRTERLLQICPLINLAANLGSAGLDEVALSSRTAHSTPARADTG